MRFSLVTATLNSACTLQDTIESILRQSFLDIEYIVVDGGSTDSTIELLQKYAPAFHGRMRWISEKDYGLYDAMNKGFRMATGDVIAVMNSDDFFESSFAIEKVASKFLTTPDADAVYADLYYVAQHDTSKIIRNWVSGKQRPFRYGWHPAHPTFYVKREIYQKYGLFDLDFKLAADFELMLRLIERYHIKAVYLQEPLVRMRLGGATSKNLKNIIKGNRECIQAFKKNELPVSILYPFYRLLPKLRQFFH